MISGLGTSSYAAFQINNRYTGTSSSISKGQQGGMPSVEDTVSSIMEQHDGNGDGLLSLEESGLNSDMMSNLDSDGDGFASADELEDTLEALQELGPPPPMNGMGAGPGGMGGPPPGGPSGGESAEDIATSIIDELDTNGDGVISFDEYAASEDIWDSMDTDADGYATADELTATIQTQMEEMGPGQRPGMMPPSDGASEGSGSGLSLQVLATQAYLTTQAQSATGYSDMTSSSLMNLFA